MNLRNLLSIAAVSIATLALAVGHAKAQQPSDINAIKAADSAFYAALSARDAKAMEAVWANKPYVVNIGPASKTISVGYADAVSNHFPRAFAGFSKISASSISRDQVQTDGKLAWVIGIEGGEVQRKGGKLGKYRAFYTNIFEKNGSRWLMISHHAHRIPK